MQCKRGRSPFESFFGAIGAGREARSLAEELPKVAWARKARPSRDGRHGKPGRTQQPRRAVKAVLGEIAPRCRSQAGPEIAAKLGDAHVCGIGKVGQGKRLGIARLHERERVADSRSPHIRSSSPRRLDIRRNLKPGAGEKNENPVGVLLVARHAVAPECGELSKRVERALFPRGLRRELQHRQRVVSNDTLDERLGRAFRIEPEEALGKEEA